MSLRFCRATAGLKQECEQMRVRVRISAQTALRAQTAPMVSAHLEAGFYARDILFVLVLEFANVIKYLCESVFHRFNDFYKFKKIPNLRIRNKKCKVKKYGTGCWRCGWELPLGSLSPPSSHQSRCSCLDNSAAKTTVSSHLGRVFGEEVLRTVSERQGPVLWYSDNTLEILVFVMTDSEHWAAPEDHPVCCADAARPLKTIPSGTGTQIVLLFHQNVRDHAMYVWWVMDCHLNHWMFHRTSCNSQILKHFSSPVGWASVQSLLRSSPAHRRTNPRATVRRIITCLSWL